MKDSTKSIDVTSQGGVTVTCSVDPPPSGTRLTAESPPETLLGAAIQIATELRLIRIELESVGAALGDLDDDLRSISGGLEGRLERSALHEITDAIERERR